MPSSTDQIVKEIHIAAPPSRVWSAIADSARFGAWFGVAFEGPFVPGEHLRGKITEPPDYAGMDCDITVDRIEPETLFSFRWHPYAIDPGADYRTEPTTLIEFTLSSTKDGTLLRVVESGFDNVPLDRRAQAFAGNEEGWAIQVENVRRYVERND
jgi:uncharacterized protein YndB with AHSA1/START domain